MQQRHKPRWAATVTYRSNCKSLVVEHEFEEMEELHNIVEQGPHWDTIILIEVRLQRVSTHAELTIEEAEKL